MVMTENGEDGPADGAEALAEVEEQMMQLAAYVRGAMRDTALRIDPALQPFGLKILRMLRRC